MNFSVNNDTILEKCSISRMQLLELCLGEEGLEGVFRSSSWWFFAPGVCAVWGVCFCTGHTFSGVPGGHFWESPREKKKAQNAVTLNGHYHAFVAGAGVPLLTVSCL